MRSMRRALLACVVCGLVGLVSWPVVARAEEASLAVGSGPLVLSNPTVVVGSPEEAQELQYERESRLDSPEAVLVREASRTEFEGLDSEQAGKLAGESFPRIVDVAAGGSPQLPTGERIVSYPTSNTAQLELPDHKGAVLESLSPIAIETSSSTRVPIDLSLSESAGQFQPVQGLVGVHIPKRLADGVSLSERGVSLTPVDAQGQSLASSEGSLVGASVLYANTSTDTDTLVKPTTNGFDVDALLRSVLSPGHLYLRVGMPAGAVLVRDGQGGARVMLEGQTIASVLAPAAQDAAESPVPVSMSVSGDLLVVGVDDSAGSYQYPIEVDPSIVDSQLAKSGAKRANWEFSSEPSGSTKFGHTYAACKGPGEQYLETCATGEYQSGEFAVWIYQTRGNSKIFEFKGETEAENTSARIESRIELQDGGTLEEYEPLSTETKEPKYAKRPLPEPLCPKGKTTCTSSYGGEKNAVHFQQSVTANGGSKFWDYLYSGEVSITEPEDHATTMYNTTSPELEGEVTNGKGEKEKLKRKNVLDGGGWLSEHDGAAELVSEDKGIGVSATQMEFESSPGKWEQIAKHNYLTEEDLCKGYQCEPKDEEFWVLSPRLPNGEDKIRYRAEDGMAGTESTESEGIATVKVDTSKPRKLTVGDLPYGNELSEREYHLTVEATDGEGSTVASSGIESISFYVDEHLIGTKGAVEGEEEGKCSQLKGECTASVKWALNGAELGAGKHQIEVIAHDRAGNEERFYDPISIRHSTPVSMGPGSVDLESGDYALGTTDVSMGSGLSVSRAYSSRATEEGDEGPLGPEWSLTVGGSAESLVEMVDHSMLLTGNNGRQTIFAKTESSTYESPVGDSNLKLTVEENKTTKAQEAFYLEDAADHTKVKFTLPSGGTKVWVPTTQEGAVPTDTVTYKYKTVGSVSEYLLPSGSKPSSIVAGPNGRLWFTNSGTGKIGEITTTGAVIEYSLPSESSPYQIAVGSEGDLWFTERVNKSTGAGKIGKMTPTGTYTIYTVIEGVNLGGITAGPEKDMWFTEEDGIGKITPAGTVTIYKVAESLPLSITIGSEGELWFTEGTGSEFHIGKVGKITTAGVVTTYPTLSGEVPNGIVAGPRGEKGLWFTDAGASKIGKITTAGSVTEYFVGLGKSTGSEPNSITVGSDNNLWFTNLLGRVEKITTEGVNTEYAMPTSSEPYGIAAGPDGNLWFTEYGSNKIVMITTSGTLTEPTEALAPVPAGVSCSPIKAGCRALKFSYAPETTAKGEAQSEWGAYNGRLTKISIEIYNPVSKKMEEIPVAEYLYDPLGRLRTEWDPRVSPALKTTYGYDAEGHVTGMTAPGKESWAFTYGPIAGDTGTGRLLKVTQAPASASLWGGALPANTEAPKISGTPAFGTRLAVSNGVWSGSPVAYAYQWEDCNSSGMECAPIIGAMNANYTPARSDAGHTLIVKVTAANGGGSVIVASAASAVVTTSSFIQSVDSGVSVNAVSCSPSTTDCVISDSNGNAYYSTNVSSSSGSTWKSWAGPGKSPSEAMDCLLNSLSSLCLMAAGKGEGYGGTLYYATSLGGSWTQASSPAYGIDAISCASSTFCVAAQDGDGYYRYATNPASTSWTLKEQGTASMKGVFCLSSSFCAIADGAGSVHIATSTSQIESSSWTSTGVDGTSALNGIACTSTTSCLTIDGSGNVLNLTVASKGEATATKHSIDSTSSLTAITCTTSSTCVTVDNKGNVFVSTNSGETWTEKYVLEDDLTSVSCSSASLCVTVDTTGNVISFNPTSSPGSEGEVRTPQPGFAIDYDVHLEGSNAPVQMGVNPSTHKPETEQWGQTEDVPVEATSIFPSDSPQGWPASSYTRATTYYLDEQGRIVNVETPSNGKYGAISTSEYNEENDVTRTLTPDNRAAALEAGEKSVEVATLLSTFNTYKNKCSRESEFNEERESSEFGTRLCETEGPEHIVKYTGTKGQEEGEARDHVRYFYDEKVPAEGPNKESFSKETFNLVTETQNLTEILGSKGRVEQEIEPRTTITSYSGQNNLGWALRAPTSVTIDTETGGQKLKSTTLYNQAGQVTETRSPEGESGSSARDAKIVYYTPENEAEVASCRKHPEWAGLVCQTLPAKQPETSGIPNLPVTETTYNMWDEPEAATETFTFAPHPTSIRTRKDTYDTAGRLTSSETTVTGNEDKTLPKVTYEYESKQGALDGESATISGKTKTIADKFNTLGQLTEYTDASGENAAKYVYGGPENDFQVQEVSDSSNGAKSRQTYAYNKNTMQMETLWDSAAETFTASYDTEGKLTSETYPNGMCANYTYNSVGEATHLEYIKTTNCSEGSKAPVWYSETIGSTVRGETLNRTSTLATENYSYDTLGRLTETQETPAGGECSVRLYEYEKESNRTKLTSRKPGSKGECATTGGTEEKHTYDEANRMTDTGIEYEGLGNITKLPATDAEGHELKSTFYIDGAIASQSQNGVTNEYGLEPAGRILTIASGGKTTINHYDGAGETVAWACEAATGTETCESGKWTRNIPGIDGALAAVQTSGATPVLQLHDLKGDIIATAELTSSATKLLTTYNSTEFGVPNKEKTPPSFAWLGAADVSKSLSSGVITYGATSYVPQTGRTLQTLPVQSPGYPTPIGGGTYATFTAEPWNMQGAARIEAEAPGISATEQREAAEEACRVNPGSCAGSEGEESESSGSIVDPSAMLSLNMSKLILHFLNYGNEALGEFLASKLGNFGVVITTVLALFSEDAHIFAEDLGVCVEDIEATTDVTRKYARCKAYLDLYEDVLPTSWGVETCWPNIYKKKGRIVKVTWPYCEKV
jgi:YD repeat-containing protein